jgi:hypothetical protein
VLFHTVQKHFFNRYHIFKSTSWQIYKEATTDFKVLTLVYVQECNSEILLLSFSHLLGPSKLLFSSVAQSATHDPAAAELPWRFLDKSLRTHTYLLNSELFSIKVCPSSLILGPALLFSWLFYSHLSYYLHSINQTSYHPLGDFHQIHFHLNPWSATTNSISHMYKTLVFLWRTLTPIEVKCMYLLSFLPSQRVTGL